MLHRPTAYYYENPESKAPRFLYDTDHPAKERMPTSHQEQSRLYDLRPYDAGLSILHAVLVQPWDLESVIA